MAIGSTLFIIGAGLLYTLDVNTPLSNAIGYQVLLGFGTGIGIQMPVIVGQAFSKPEDLSAATAIVLCKCISRPCLRDPSSIANTTHPVFQMMGGTVFISAGQLTFGNRLLQNLTKVAPNIDAGKVLATGASKLRETFLAEQIDVILASYMSGLRDTFALSIAITGCAFLACWVAPWQSIKRGVAAPHIVVGA